MRALHAEVSADGEFGADDAESEATAELDGADLDDVNMERWAVSGFLARSFDRHARRRGASLTRALSQRLTS